MIAESSRIPQDLHWHEDCYFVHVFGKGETIKSAEDAYGNNALWFASYLANNYPGIASEIGKYFASCGCDLDKPFKAGFSWNTMVHVMSIIERHKQQ